MQLRFISVMSMLLAFALVICISSCATDESYEAGSSIISGTLGELYDAEANMTISNYGQLVVLESCEIKETKLTLPTEFSNGLKINYVGDHTFNNCDDIVELVIPDGYEQIGHFAFNGCENLKTVHLGKDVAYIGERAFAAAPSLEKFTVSSDNPYLYEKDGCVVTKDGDVLIATNGVIPGGIKEIGASVFGGNKEISSVIIPDGTEKICGYAFAGSSLSDVLLPQSLTSIGKHVFSECNLNEIYIPKNVIDVDASVFSGIKGLVINCEVETKPEGWSDDWLDGCEYQQINWGAVR